MNHYTLILNRPQSILAERFPKIQVRRTYGTQALVWDGPANKKDITRLYDALLPYCAGIALYRGKRIRSNAILSAGEWD